MNIARVVVLIIALSAGGVAAYLARGTEEKSRTVPEPVAQLPTVEILVAKSDIGLGQSVKPEDLQWQIWPASAAAGRSGLSVGRSFRRPSAPQSHARDRP